MLQRICHAYTARFGADFGTTAPVEVNRAPQTPASTKSRCCSVARAHRGMLDWVPIK
jgi:hypothetical protein